MPWPERPHISVGSFVMWFRREDDAGEVVSLDGNFAIVRYETGPDERIHTHQLTWVPNTDEIAALKASIKAVNDEAHRLSSVSHYRPGDGRRINSHNPRRGVTVGIN